MMSRYKCQDLLLTNSLYKLRYRVILCTGLVSLAQLELPKPIGSDPEPGSGKYSTRPLIPMAVCSSDLQASCCCIHMAHLGA